MMQNGHLLSSENGTLLSRERPPGICDLLGTRPHTLCAASQVSAYRVCSLPDFASYGCVFFISVCFGCFDCHVAYVTPGATGFNADLTFHICRISGVSSPRSPRRCPT